MIAPRAQRINIPLRHVAIMCGGMLFALLANVTYLQALGTEQFEEDPRNRRTMIARFGSPRGDILLHDGTVVATSIRSGDNAFRYRRVYPTGPLYAAVTGHFSMYGTAGIERAEDAVLSGSEPRVKVRGLVDGTRGGATLRLTIDRAAQRAAYEGLRAVGLPGAVVAIEPGTGAILAMVSYPSYDPNLYATFDGARLDRVDKRLQADPRDPLLNRAIQRNYPPGSTFKIVTGGAALGSGRYGIDTPVSAPAVLRLPGTATHLRNAGGAACGDGTPSLLSAFKLSCNTPFAQIGIDLGQDALREQAERFGFDADLDVPMPVARSIYPTGMDRAQTAMSALGQFDTRATPLMIAMMAAAVANHGTLMRPYLVEDVRLPDGTVIDETESAPYRQALRPAEADRLVEMMTAVTGPGGTGTAAAVPGVTVAAKTGTAENTASGRDHAVFTGFAPVAAPRVAVGVLIEGGGFGGRVAAPVARAVFRAVLDRHAE
ncbi:peptidoglycan glycosyltransferase [Streptosporangium becharense]|uniref:Peptidoglycan glycosyltransferase n=1 Tax=Streptosporangium becharense TaxID=1816182 RepID=A0A7W9MI29_9ACTN|nr:penicillin-binding protein 2 [Streptosporangium becharense]MBB2911382.1 peptidoglycan glycosyltransferase [Streptosporangium becharense]MBB5821560.1 peptidoglycan glycosyltransferase [Streptosporangium becharense]